MLVFFSLSVISIFILTIFLSLSFVFFDSVDFFSLHPFRKPKRVRTAFSPGQLLKLEHAFESNQYVVGAERKALAQTLNLSETQVCIYIGNSIHNPVLRCYIFFVRLSFNLNFIPQSISLQIRMNRATSKQAKKEKKHVIYLFFC